MLGFKCSLADSAQTQCMPNQQKHRGQHPQDHLLFADNWKVPFGKAAVDLAYLWERGYAENSSVKIVGDRYRLNVRQRKALVRLCCHPGAIQKRLQTHLPPDLLKGRTVVIDGFNLIIFVESALSKGIILNCMDGVYRDIASVHGSYKRVVETGHALQLIGEVLNRLEVAAVHWYLDAPVSNSGRLRGFIRQEAEEQGLNWEVNLVADPDKDLVALEGDEVVVSSDGWILDQAKNWVNLNAYLLQNDLTKAVIFDCLSS